MTPSVTPPNRRRRTVVVGTIAVLTVIGLVSWWFWPRVDQRFAGTWNYVHVDADGRESRESIVLDDAGYCENPRRPRVGGRDVLNDTRWFVHGSRLAYFHPAWSTGSSDLMNRLTIHVELFLARTIFRKPTLGTMWYFDILDVTESTIRMRDEYGREESIYRRASSR